MTYIILGTFIGVWYPACFMLKEIVFSGTNCKPFMRGNDEIEPKPLILRPHDGYNKLTT